MTTPVFQRATVASAACMAAVHRAALLPGEPAWQAPAFAGLLATPPVRGLIATVDDMPVGFILWRTVAPDAELLLVAVLRDVRRRGLGSALLRHAMAAARADGAERIFLEVAVDNPAPIALYTAAGFVCVSIRRAYYQRVRGECTDALVLRRNLAIRDEILDG